MKSPTVFVCAALPAILSGVPASGQTTLTVTGGLNMASISMSERDDAIESIMRLAMGLSAAGPVAEGWRVQVGATYSQKGFGFGPVDVGIDYIEVTGLLDRPFPLGDRASLHLLAGPALGIRMSCQSTVGDHGVPVASVPGVRGIGRVDCDEVSYKPFDFGVAGGAQAEIGLSDRRALSVGASYTLGLLDIADGGSDGFLKTRTLALRVGVVFPVG